MFQPKKKSKLQIEIDKLVLELNDYDAGTKEYGVIMDRLSTLNKIEVEQRPDRLTWNVGATVAANLIGIAIIVRHEHLNYITSKALSFVKKA